MGTISANITFTKGPFHPFISFRWTLAGRSLDISPPNGYYLLLRLIRFLRTLMKRKPSSKAKHHVTYLLGGDSPLTTEQQQKLRNAMHDKRVRSRPAKKRRRSY